MAYPNTAALVNASDEPSLTTLDAPTQDELRALAIAAIEDFCGQKFQARVATKILDGGGGRTMMLDERLAQITALSVSHSSLGLTDVVLNDRHSELSVGADVGGGNWVERVLREDQRPMFTTGVGTVTITGTWGWLDTELDPDDVTNPVAMALRLDMEDQALLRSGPLAETTRVMAKAQADTLSEGPLRLSRSQSIVPLSQSVQTLLTPDYIWQPVARVT